MNKVISPIPACKNYLITQSVWEAKASDQAPEVGFWSQHTAMGLKASLWSFLIHDWEVPALFHSVGSVLEDDARKFLLWEHELDFPRGSSLPHYSKKSPLSFQGHPWKAGKTFHCHLALLPILVQSGYRLMASALQFTK
jgi:hypothetical protein